MCKPYLRFAFIQRDCHSNISLQRVPEAWEQLLNWSWFSLPRPLRLRLSHAIEHAPSQTFWKRNYRRKKIGLMISWAYYSAESFIANILGPYKYSSGKSFPPVKVCLMPFKLFKILFLHPVSTLPRSNSFHLRTRYFRFYVTKLLWP